MNDITDADLEKAIAGAMEAPQTPTPPPPVRTPLRSLQARPGTSLTEQLGAFEKVRVELHDRLRREALRLEGEYRTRREQLLADYATRISETVAGLEAKRAAELAELAREYHSHASEVAQLVRRINQEARS